MFSIYTDASYAGNGFSGWGYMIRQPDGSCHYGGGAFKVRCPSSMVAEIYAVANALSHALKAGTLSDGARVIVYTDCSGIVPHLRSGRYHAKKRPARKVDTINAVDATLAHIAKVATEARLAISYEWVPGHQSTTKGCPHAIGNAVANTAAQLAKPEHPKRPVNPVSRRSRLHNLRRWTAGGQA